MRCRNQTSQDLKKLQEKKPALGRDNNDGFVKHEEEKTLSVESNNESPLKMVNDSIHPGELEKVRHQLTKLNEAAKMDTADIGFTNEEKMALHT